MQKCTITRRGQGSFDASRLYFNSPKFRQASCSSQSLLALSSSVVSGSWVNDMKAITHSCEARNAMKFHFCICKDNPWWNWKRSAAHHQRKTCKTIWTIKRIFKHILFEIARKKSVIWIFKPKMYIFMQRKNSITITTLLKIKKVTKNQIFLVNVKNTVFR